MRFNLLDTVVLTEDISEYDLKKGDLGAIVEVYPSGEYEVEFVGADAHTQALITLNDKLLRPVEPSDMIAVRPLQDAVAA